MVKVRLWGGLRDLVDGASELEIEAATINDVVSRLGADYPGLRTHLDENVSIAVDGQVYRDSLFVPLKPDAEVFLLPRLSGG
jgi:molybdopterin synthase sulfur carrier subunit